MTLEEKQKRMKTIGFFVGIVVLIVVAVVYFKEFKRADE